MTGCSKGNLFSNVFDVREILYGDTVAGVELDKLCKNVNTEIEEDVMPESLRYVLFKITEHCNSDCEYCEFAASRCNPANVSDVPHEKIMEVIEDAADSGVLAMTISGGEPLLRADILEIIEAMVERKIVPVLLTNGLLLPQMWEKLGDAGLRYLIISMDSLNRDVFERQRGVSFDRAMEGIDAAVKMIERFPGMEVHVSAVLTRYSQDDYIELVKYMSGRGIKVQVSPFHNQLGVKDELSPNEEERIRELAQTLIQMKKDGYLISSSTGFLEHLPDLFNRGLRVPEHYKCKVGYCALFIDAQMNVKPCWSTLFRPLGNLEHDRITDIWRGDAMSDYRKKMLFCECEGCWYMCTGEVTMMLDERL